MRAPSTETRWAWAVGAASCASVFLAAFVLYLLVSLHVIAQKTERVDAILCEFVTLSLKDAPHVAPDVRAGLTQAARTCPALLAR